MSCLHSADGSLVVCRPPHAQPATRFRSALPIGPRWVKIPGGRLLWCYKCERRRPARNLLVIEQAWYDPVFFCAPNKRCAIDRGRKG